MNRDKFKSRCPKMWEELVSSSSALHLDLKKLLQGVQLVKGAAQKAFLFFRAEHLEEVRFKDLMKII